MKIKLNSVSVGLKIGFHILLYSQRGYPKYVLKPPPLKKETVQSAVRLGSGLSKKAILMKNGKNPVARIKMENIKELL